MSARTPGPWKADRTHPTAAVTYIDVADDSDEVAVVYCTDLPERAAAARLIAKAPSMHALLSELADYLDVPESAAGGDDTARAYCKRIRELLS